MVDMAHYAGLVAAGVYPSPVGIADYTTTTTHKTLRGPRGGLILMRAEHEKAINSAVFPGLQGGPLMHVIAAKGVALGEALHREFKVYQERVLENARVWRACSPTAACASCPAARIATCSSSTCGRRASPARTPRQRSGVRTSRSTRTRFPTIPRSRS